MDVKTGIGVIIIKEGRVLLGLRKNSHGVGTWSFPGGHLEMFETWEDCARREVYEETGLIIYSPEFVGATNDIFENDHKHYVTIFMKAGAFSGNPVEKEPEKCEKWEWHYWDNLPEPLFLPIKNLIKQGFTP